MSDFRYADGAHPAGGLIQGNDGKLYGTTTYGGLRDEGTIFSFDPASSTFTKLKDFEESDGMNPRYGLLQASDGKLYGVTTFGGSVDFYDGYDYTHGVFFVFDPSSSTFTILQDFDGYNGAFPVGSLVEGSDGKIYGSTIHGGNLGAGTIFSFDLASSVFETVFNFDDVTTGSACGSLIRASDGKLYGAAGNGAYATLVSFDPASHTYTTIRSLDPSYGGIFGKLFQASNGILYGLGAGGGPDTAGVIFSLDPTTSAFTLLNKFDYSNGSNALVTTNSAFIELAQSAVPPARLIYLNGINEGNFNKLVWDITNEVYLDYYELERSADSLNFENVGRVKSTGDVSYNYMDPIAQHPDSVYFYRLKLLDYSGNSSYSPVVRINLGSNGYLVRVSQNPFNGILNVTVQSPNKGRVQATFTNTIGQQLFKKEELLSTGLNSLQFAETGKLARGTYILTISSPAFNQSFKVVKVN